MGRRDFFHLFQGHQELRKVRPVPPEQAAEIQDRGMTLPRIPFRFAPPTVASPGVVHAGLQQPQQGQSDQLDLEGPQDGLFRPRPAFFHTQTLFVVAEAVLLPETRRPGCHHFGGRPLQGRGDQEPGLLVALHLDHEDMDGDLRATDRPATAELFVAEAPPATIHPRATALPAHRPVQMVLGAARRGPQVGGRPLPCRRGTTG